MHLTKIITVYLFAFTLFFQYSKAQPRVNSFFLRNKPMPVGAYYYPEHWPEQDWEPNLKKMAELGFTFTHFAEFAWDRLEPKEGVYDFTWLDKAIDIADKQGLKVIMCTPTPTPPTWMVRKYPEITVMGKNMLRKDQGGRRHGNISSDVFMQFVDKIVTQMAKKYGNDPRIIGWQIDNEPHISGGLDYSPESAVKFRLWLRNKYGNDIKRLNYAWGNPFWAQTYDNFDAINVPNPDANGVNVHHQLDFALFNAHQVGYFLQAQAAILKKHIMPTQWVTTNYAFMKFLPEVDPMLTRGHIDFASYTMYLLSTWLEYPKGNLNFRLGSGMEMSFTAELCRSHSGFTGIMELQPGQINWGAYNAQPYPGAIKMWLYHNYGLGAEFVCTYRFRQPVFGGELYHKGIMETDGKTIAPGGQEYVDFIKELRSIYPQTTPGMAMPADHAARRTAIIWNMPNQLDLKIGNHINRWEPLLPYYTWYSAAKACGAPVDFITDDETFDPNKHPFLIAPSYQIMSKQMIAKLSNYVKDGGHLILNSRSGIKDSLGHLWQGLPAPQLKPLTGNTILMFDQLPPDKQNAISFDGKNYNWNLYADIITPDKNVSVWGTHVKNLTASVSGRDEPFYHGTAAITHNKLGKGTVTYVGTITTERELEKTVLQKVMRTANAKPMDLPFYVFVEWRDGCWVAVNYTSEIFKAPITANQKILAGRAELRPGDYCVWK
jgi:beta-galactosidase